MQRSKRALGALVLCREGSVGTRPANRQTTPDLTFERTFWSDGFRLVAGVDEVGRGALAGPLVAAAVVLPTCANTQVRRLRRTLDGVRDSKQISRAMRPELAERIYDVAESVTLGMVDASELDEIGVGAANRLAMERALAAQPSQPDIALLDACVVDLAIPQIGLIRGDSKSLSIAAASIIAKVSRDQIMAEWHLTDPRYGFGQHMGYGTAEHLLCLLRYGPSPCHRKAFAPVRLLSAR